MSVKRIETHDQAYALHAFDLIHIVSFLPAFKLASDTNGIRKWAARWLIQCLKKTSPAVVPNALSYIKLTSSSTAPSANSEAYGTEGIITEIYAALAC